MDTIEVPPYFLCPISLQIMRDPVTVCTGISYDRESMEKWIYTYKNTSCPVTNQTLSDQELTPNHTLRRLIQAWCTANSSNGIERFPTPKPPVCLERVNQLLAVARLNDPKLSSLRELRDLAIASEMNRRRIGSAGAIPVMAHLILGQKDRGDESMATIEEALSIIHVLQVLEDTVKSIVASDNGAFIDSLSWVLLNGSYRSRLYSVSILKTVLKLVEPTIITSLKPELFRAMVRVMNNQVSSQATKCVLQILMEVCSLGRNRVKACEEGAMPVIIQMLIESTERRERELLLGVLDLLCGCAEGRAELLRHGAGVAVVSKKIFRVSTTATERAVKILWSLCKYSATHGVLMEMLNIGAVSKLCMVVQTDCSFKAKEKAKEALRMHAKTWKSSPCVPSHLLSAFSIH
ncbi:hypothetical protein AMTRI_Chr11g95110 [Amborella trichopoda]|uniref:U-box domain-containing protein n=1 Tax=Amborella trichopoda TaxID=13333 RepID=U5D1J3_AMBTC|nr:E3 ubiquitin-protein ligase PUB23 [Amborella trichopoda]ERN16085.1 hypothetical protein AMTR_s00030p00159240 [Amborella trichopoda]|eukprot:XP_006854618.1 E3 ubiquitin-protein ligase PUB23 [Amborella trichopoda]